MLHLLMLRVYGPFLGLAFLAQGAYVLFLPLHTVLTPLVLA